MNNFELQDNQKSVLYQGLNFCKDYAKSGDDLNSNISKNISEIINDYANDENISEISKERVAKYGIDANVKIACNRNMWTGIGIVSVSVASIIIGGILINKKDS